MPMYHDNPRYSRPASTVEVAAPARFLVAPAPGYYGDTTVAISTHRTLEAAKRAIRGKSRAVYAAGEGEHAGCKLYADNLRLRERLA